MDLKDRKYKRSKNYAESFQHAFTGLKTAFLEERNMRFHTFAALAVVICGFFFHVTKSEWILLTLSIFGVLTLEMVNTAIERAVDVATEQYIDEAKKAKDVAAGAVLLAAVVASFIGLIIFIPYFCQMFL